jgi:hypothetical protein
MMEPDHEKMADLPEGVVHNSTVVQTAIIWTNLYGVRWQFHVGPAHLKGRCHQDQPRTGHVQAMQKAAVVPSVGQDGPRPQHVLRWLWVKTFAP